MSCSELTHAGSTCSKSGDYLILSPDGDQTKLVCGTHLRYYAEWREVDASDLAKLGTTPEIVEGALSTLNGKRDRLRSQLEDLDEAIRYAEERHALILFRSLDEAGGES